MRMKKNCYAGDAVNIDLADTSYILGFLFLKTGDRENALKRFEEALVSL